MLRILPVALVAALSVGRAPALLAGTIHVPADHPTIQGAIDAAQDGDLVLVAPGTYFENIDFKGKAITVQSSDGPNVTTIDGGGVNSVARFTSGETSAAVLDGFRLTNGYGPSSSLPYDGGGINCHNGSSPTIVNNWIDYNVAESGGGGIACDASSPTIENCRIENNQAFVGGGVMAENSSVPLVRFCVITSNRGGRTGASGGGGGIYSRRSAMTVVNTIIAGNSADLEGGGLDVIDRGMLLVNSVVWGNSLVSGTAGTGAWVWATTLTLWNSIVWNNDFGTAAGGQVTTHSSNCPGGSIYLDPLFVNPAAGDFHLTAGSPCIDVGDATAPGLPPTDIDGDSRIIGASVDIGADEFVPGPLVTAVTPDHDRYDQTPSVLVQGSGFAVDAIVNVRFGPLAASNVVVLDDANLTCDAPVSDRGPVDVGVSNSHGEGVLSLGFIFTPAITIEGDPTPGGSITIHYLFDGGDGVLAIWGLPPAVDLSVPPWDGKLCILPLRVLFYLPSWPFDGLDVDADIANDPSLSGVDVLLQALVGPRLTRNPRDGAWTNCFVLEIR